MGDTSTGRRRPVTSSTAASDTTATANAEAETSAPVVTTAQATNGSDSSATSPSNEDASGEQMEEARVLVEFDGLAVNSIHTAPFAEIDRLWRDGKVDPHPDAIAAVRDGMM